MSELYADGYIDALVKRLRVDTPYSRHYRGLMKEASTVIEALRHASHPNNVSDLEPVASLVWLQGRRAIDDVEDYYEIAQVGDKCADGSDPFPVYAGSAVNILRQEVTDLQTVNACYTEDFSALKAKYEALSLQANKHEDALHEIATSDDIDNALDPERNKRVARAAFSGERTLVVTDEMVEAAFVEYRKKSLTVIPKGTSAQYERNLMRSVLKAAINHKENGGQS